MAKGGPCAIWAMRNGDYEAHVFEGNQGGLTAALAYVGSNGVVHVYPGNSLITVPSLSAGVKLHKHEAGIETQYGKGGALSTGVNVRDYATFQAAHDALPAAGGTIFVPAGTYTSTTDTAFTGMICTKRVSIIGEGGGPAYASTTITHDMSGAEDVDAIYLNVANSCVIKNLFIQGNSVAATGSGGCGIKWYKAASYLAGLHIENVTLYNTSNWGISATCDSGYYVSKLSCIGVTAYGALAGGSVLVGATGANSNNNWFDRCEFNGPGFSTFSTDTLPRGAVHLIRNSTVRFKNCAFQGPRDSPALSIDQISTDIVLRDCYREYLATGGTSVHSFVIYGPCGYFFIDGMFHQASANDTRLIKTGTAGPALTSINLRRVHCQANQDPLAGTEVIALGNTTDRLNVEHCFEEGSTTGVRRDLVASGVGAVIATIASTATITIPDGTEDTYFISGTADITSITAVRPKRRITLIFTGTKATNGMVDGSNLKLNGTFAYTPDDSITLVSDGTNWIEVCRSAN